MPRIIMLALVLLYAVSGPVAGGEQTRTFAVQNMTCALCPITVSRAIKAVPGVLSVMVNDEADIAVVIFEDTATSPAAIAQASTNAGYPARLVE